MVKGWENFPLRVYATPNLPQLQVGEAYRFWERETQGRFTFRVVERPEEAQIVLTTTWPPPELGQDVRACGAAVTKRLEKGVMLSGIAHFAPGCAIDAKLIAHELGHLLGPIGGHTERGDVMSNSYSELKLSPLLVEVLGWLRLVPPNTRPM